MKNRELADYCTAHWSPPRFLCGDCKYMNNICLVFRKKYEGESPYMLHVQSPQIYTDEEIPNQEDTMKLADIEPIIKAIKVRQDNAEDLPPLTTGDFLRMLREASESKTLTNLDRIRAMTPEELAEFLKGYDVDVSGVYFCAADGACPHAKECYDRFREDDDPSCVYHSDNPVMEAQRRMWLDWLKQEWKGGQDE